MNFEQWSDYKKGNWTREIDVRSFIQNNYTPYFGDETFLRGISVRTEKVWSKCK